MKRRVYIVLACILGGAFVTLLLGFVSGLFIVAPWSKRSFLPVNPVSVYDASLDMPKMLANLSSCDLVWMTSVKGVQETTYKSGPEYVFYLTPISIHGDILIDWKAKLVSVEMSGKPLLMESEIYLATTISAYPVQEHTLSDQVRIYPSYSMNIGSLAAVSPGDMVAITVQLEVHLQGDKTSCFEEQNFEFECVQESGLIRTLR